MCFQYLFMKNEWGLNRIGKNEWKLILITSLCKSLTCNICPDIKLWSQDALQVLRSISNANISDAYAGKVAKHLKQADDVRQDTIVSDKIAFVTDYVLEHFGLANVAASGFQSKLKRTAECSVADVIALRSLADASPCQLNKHRFASHARVYDLAFAMMFGKRVALPSYLDSPGTFTAEITLKCQAAPLKKRGTATSDEFWKNHRFLAGAIDKVVGKFNNGWVRNIES